VAISTFAGRSTAATTWLTPSLVIAILALIFTVASFWWIQVRRAKLTSYPPRSYAGYFHPNDIRLVLPLVLYNLGPAPIVVLDFRLHVRGGTPTTDGTRSPVPFTMSWQATQPKLEPARVGGGRVMPSPIPIAGRSAVDRFIEFGRAIPVGLPLDLGPYDVTIDVLEAHGTRWRQLVRFSLHTELTLNGESAGAFIVRNNDPEWRR
jgi:hypothetical protein